MLGYIVIVLQLLSFLSMSYIKYIDNFIKDFPNFVVRIKKKSTELMNKKLLI